jgi:cellulose 1,4-beta-cellobiosidase
MRREWWITSLLACAAANAAEPPSPANPFEGARFYVSPKWVEQVESAAAAYPDKAAVLRTLKSQPVALWVNSIGAVKDDVPFWLDAARDQLAVLVLYDLPNRDCAANASAGELARATRRDTAAR